jgi:hypothetical protein
VKQGQVRGVSMRSSGLTMWWPLERQGARTSVRFMTTGVRLIFFVPPVFSRASNSSGPSSGSNCRALTSPAPPAGSKPSMLSRPDLDGRPDEVDLRPSLPAKRECEPALSEDRR